MIIVDFYLVTQSKLPQRDRGSFDKTFEFNIFKVANFNVPYH